MSLVFLHRSAGVGGRQLQTFARSAKLEADRREIESRRLAITKKAKE
jgi:hypothetical protein